METLNKEYGTKENFNKDRLAFILGLTVINSMDGLAKVIWIKVH